MMLGVYLLDRIISQVSFLFGVVPVECLQAHRCAKLGHSET